jgi:ATP-binding protein involved in chromosome partitioning
MFDKVGVPILGIVENMAVFVCPNCGHAEHIFGAEGGQKMAAQYKVPYLGALPLNRSIREQSDAGHPPVVAEPEGEIAQLYRTLAQTVALGIAAKSKDYSAKFPTITVSKST